MQVELFLVEVQDVFVCLDLEGGVSAFTRVVVYPNVELIEQHCAEFG